MDRPVDGRGAIVMPRAERMVGCRSGVVNKQIGAERVDKQTM
jgi:hypothetical protein